MKKITGVLFLSLLFSSCQKQRQVEQDNFLVEVVLPAKAVLTETLREYPFISAPYNETQLSFRVNGPVRDFDLRSGQAFKKGDLLLAIDDRDFLVRKQQAEAVYLQAEGEFKRINALYEKNNISGSNYERAKAEYLVSKSNLESTENALQDTRLIAPYDGYIQAVHIEPFQDVKATQPIVTFIELDRLKIETFISEDIALLLNDADKLKQHLVTLRFDNTPDTEVSPSKVYVSKSTTHNNLSFLLTAILPNPDKKWLGGMSGSLALRLPEGCEEERLYLPLHAVCHRPSKGDFVWIVKDNKACLTPIKIGKLAGNQIEILQGIDEDDLVISTRQSFLSENKVVTIQH